MNKQSARSLCGEITRVPPGAIPCPLGFINTSAECREHQVEGAIEVPTGGVKAGSPVFAWEMPKDSVF
jgi:hypothetical protein